ALWIVSSSSTMRSVCLVSAMVGLSVGGGVRRCRPVHAEPGSRVQFGVEVDAAAVRLDDLLDQVHAEAGALPGPLRGEERREDLRPDLGRHADARVLDAEA